MGKILIPLALVAIFLAASGGTAKAAPAPTDGEFEPNIDAEFDACVTSVEDKPETAPDGVMRSGRPWDVWLTYVAFVRAYGRKPSGDAAETARVQALLECIRDRLAAEQNDHQGDEPPEIATTPTPGKWYRIQYGDTLFEVSKKAYPGGLSLEGKPASNYLAARWINEADANRRFWRIVEAEKNLFPQGRITFLPRFGTFEAQRADPLKGGEIGAGGGYAVIWIPVPPGG